MPAQTLLRLAFAFNILVLLPVVWSLYAHDGRGALAAFGGRVQNVDALRLLLAALWSGVLIASLAGLWAPRPFAGLLVFQVVYKAIWLATFVWPAWRADGADAVPWGVAGVFMFIVAVWPFIIAAVWQEVGFVRNG